MSTRRRRYGQDTPFGAWLREQKSIDATEHGLTGNDVDFMFHKYKENVDGLGPRLVHLMMHVEVKTNGGMPNNSQFQTLWFTHQLLNQRRKLRDRHNQGRIGVWHFGCFILSMGGTRPDDSADIWWCCFDEHGDIERQFVTEGKLRQILGFIDDPRTLEPMSLALRRHHKTSTIMQTERVPLGFETPRIIKFQS